MKRTLFLVALVGCMSDKPDIDATGTVQSTLTWGGGNCRKTGTQGYTVSIINNGYGSYDMATTQAGAHINGYVDCGPEYCRITINQSWEEQLGDQYNFYTIDATLTLDSHDKITGSGTYRGDASCEQQMSFSGVLQ